MILVLCRLFNEMFVFFDAFGVVAADEAEETAIDQTEATGYGTERLGGCFIQAYCLGVFLDVAYRYTLAVWQNGHSKFGGKLRLVFMQICSECLRMQPEFFRYRCRGQTAFLEPLDGFGILCGSGFEIVLCVRNLYILSPRLHFTPRRSMISSGCQIRR